MPCLSLDPKVYLHVHQILPPVPVLRHMNSVHIHSPCFLQIHFDIVLLSILPKHSMWSPLFRISDQNVVCSSSLPHMLHASTHLILLELIIFMLFGVECKLWSTSLCSCVLPPLTSSYVKIFSSAACWGSVSVCVCVCMLLYHWVHCTISSQEVSFCRKFVTGLLHIFTASKHYCYLFSL
jgi:hypothetical protein